MCVNCTGTGQPVKASVGKSLLAIWHSVVATDLLAATLHISHENTHTLVIYTCRNYMENIPPCDRSNRIYITPVSWCCLLVIGYE